MTDPTGVGAAQRMGAIALPCYATGQGLAPSHTSALSMLHLLAASTAGQLGTNAAQRTELVAEIHNEFEDLE